MIIFFGRLKNHTYINYWFLKKTNYINIKYPIINITNIIGGNHHGKQ